MDANVNYFINMAALYWH